MIQIGRIVVHLIATEARSATIFQDEKSIVRATRKLVNGKVPGFGNIEVTLTIGKPNYKERNFVKQCKKAGEPFPIKKIQLKFPPKKKK